MFPILVQCWGSRSQFGPLNLRTVPNTGAPGHSGSHRRELLSFQQFCVSAPRPTAHPQSDQPFLAGAAWRPRKLSTAPFSLYWLSPYPTRISKFTTHLHSLSLTHRASRWRTEIWNQAKSLSTKELWKVPRSTEALLPTFRILSQSEPGEGMIGIESCVSFSRRSQNLRTRCSLRNGERSWRSITTKINLKHA